MAGIPQVMGNPEVMQNPGVLQSGGVGGGLETWAAGRDGAEKIGVMDVMRILEEIISELLGDLEVMRVQRAHTQVSLQQCRCQKK